MSNIHPFPARMAPEVALGVLPTTGRPLWVLDPMSGSGTTLVSARAKGHHAVGVDSDPLAVLLSRAAVSDLDAQLLEREAEALILHAKSIKKGLLDRDAYPIDADAETKTFARYWFDQRSRRELASICLALREKRYRQTAFLKCAISRMIITKQGGVSLAEDISHSRPHRTRDLAPSTPFELFQHSVRVVIRGAAFRGSSLLPAASVTRGDCRKLQFEDEAFDYVITSPPYLNAIDYLRGHKFSLIWFGHSVARLRALRSENVGTTCGISHSKWDSIIDKVVPTRQMIPSRTLNTLRRYLDDIDSTLSEVRRVVRRSGTVVVVVGDSTIRGLPIMNSFAMNIIAERNGLKPSEKPSRRALSAQSRYMPPPSLAGKTTMNQRMWDEVILKYRAI